MVVAKHEFFADVNAGTYFKRAALNFNINATDNNRHFRIHCRSQAVRSRCRGVAVKRNDTVVKCRVAVVFDDNFKRGVCRNVSVAVNFVSRTAFARGNRDIIKRGIEGGIFATENNFIDNRRRRLAFDKSEHTGFRINAECRNNFCFIFGDIDNIFSRVAKVDCIGVAREHFNLSPIAGEVIFGKIRRIFKQGHFVISAAYSLEQAECSLLVEIAANRKAFAVVNVADLRKFAVGSRNNEVTFSRRDNVAARGNNAGKRFNSSVEFNSTFSQGGAVCTCRNRRVRNYRVKCAVNRVEFSSRFVGVGISEHVGHIAGNTFNLERSVSALTDQDNRAGIAEHNPIVRSCRSVSYVVNDNFLCRVEECKHFVSSAAYRYASANQENRIAAEYELSSSRTFVAGVNNVVNRRLGCAKSDRNFATTGINIKVIQCVVSYCAVAANAVEFGAVNVVSYKRSVEAEGLALRAVHTNNVNAARQRDSISFKRNRTCSIFFCNKDEVSSNKQCRAF